MERGTNSKTPFLIVCFDTDVKEITSAETNVLGLYRGVVLDMKQRKNT